MILRILYVIFGLGSVVNGVYMLAAPEAWFHEGPPGVPNTGPVNPHFVRDVGIAFLVVGIGLLWAMVNLRRAWPLHMLATLFLGGHAVLHVAEILSEALPAEHWRHDALGVFVPAVALGVAALPPVWQRLHAEGGQPAD